MQRFNFILTLLLLTFSTSTFALTYTTLNPGSWNDVVNVWSTNGVNPCGCSPGNTVTNDIININHQLTNNTTLTIGNGSTFTVNPSGSYTSSALLQFNNSVGVINGNVTISKLTINSGSTVNFNSAVVTVNSRIEVYGTVNVDGGYLLMTGGNLSIYPGAVFNTSNNGKVDVQNGNISNAGEFNLCNTCCFTTSGNWTNESTGQVLGGGAATTTSGNMKNFGFWAITVSYCSSGNTVGMPLFENCAAANLICTIVVLPVEFTYVTGETNAEGIPQIYWGTASEKDNDYFSVMRFNGTDWDKVARVKGAGNSESAIDYTVVDRSAKPGVNYYRIQQTDYDGNATYSDYVAIVSERTSVSIAPNPASKQDLIQVFNTVSGDQISLIGSTGVLLFETIAQGKSILIDASEFQLLSGIYFIHVQNEFNQETHKLIIY